jgi:hypothetical protein
MRLSTEAMGGLVAGGLLGFSAAYLALEARFRKIYDQKAADLQQTYEFVKSLDKNEYARTLINEKIVPVSIDSEPNSGGEVIEFPTVPKLEEAVIITPIEHEPVQNAYHKALSATETPVEKFVDGAITDYGVSYIEEEEYQDDDGRLKEQILVFMDEYNPVFLEAGQPIDDWAEKIGDSIIVDFYRLVPPGVEPVLYVRNHRTGVDYEVIRQEP